jgi:hypothetical protein
MRAYSSLLGHILGSHPQINGYFEMHLSYNHAPSLNQQLALYQESEQIKANSRYLFDKLLHNQYSLDNHLFSQTGHSILVALRPPLETIRSIVKLFRNKTEPHPYANPVQATEYYVQRLHWLDQFCRNSSTPFFYFDAEMICQKPQELLTEMAEWLQLETPLREHYQLFKRTGQARAGDSSELIHQGRIQRTKLQDETIRIAQSELDVADQTYRAVRHNIRRLAKQSFDSD